MSKCRKRRRAAALVAVATIALAGCVSHPVARRTSGTVELGRSVEGRPIEATVFEGTKGSILFVGSIHGDERLAGDLVKRLADYLEVHPGARAGRTIVLIPHANPDGLAAGTRGDARGVDVNRNFPTANFAAGHGHGPRPLSEPESRALADAITRYRPSCVISVHSPLGCIDPDGGAASAALARGMARHSPLPVKDLPALLGSLGSYAGNELHLAMVTYELDRAGVPAGSSSAYLDRHLESLLAAIRDGGARRRLH